MPLWNRPLKVQLFQSVFSEPSELENGNVPVWWNNARIFFFVSDHIATKWLKMNCYCCIFLVQVEDEIRPAGCLSGCKILAEIPFKSNFVVLLMSFFEAIFSKLSCKRFALVSRKFWGHKSNNNLFHIFVVKLVCNWFGIYCLWYNIITIWNSHVPITYTASPNISQGPILA